MKKTVCLMLSVLLCCVTLGFSASAADMWTYYPPYDSSCAYYNADGTAVSPSSGNGWYEDSGGFYATNAEGSYMTFSFTGCGVRYYPGMYGAMGSISNNVELYIDDVQVGTVNCCTSDGSWIGDPDPWEYTFEEIGTHVLKIVSGDVGGATYPACPVKCFEVLTRTQEQEEEEGWTAISLDELSYYTAASEKVNPSSGNGWYADGGEGFYATNAEGSFAVFAFTGDAVRYYPGLFGSMGSISNNAEIYIDGVKVGTVNCCTSDGSWISDPDPWEYTFEEIGTHVLKIVSGDVGGATSPAVPVKGVSVRNYTAAEQPVITQGEEPSCASHQLLLSGQLGMSFYMDLSMLSESEKTASCMTFTVNGVETTVEFDAANVNENGYYAFTAYVNAVQMAEKITPVFHYGEKTLELEPYSVADYLAYIDEHASQYDAVTLALVHAVADYGHYAQPFLAGNNGWTVGDKYAEAKEYYTEEYDYAAILNLVKDEGMEKDVDNSAVEKVSYMLNLDAETGIDVFLTTAAEPALNGSLTAEKVGNRYRVSFTGIKAQELGDRVSIGGDAEGAFSVTVSGLSYVRAVLKNDSFNATAKNAVCALYNYYAAALAYLED